MRYRWRHRSGLRSRDGDVVTWSVTFRWATGTMTLHHGLEWDAVRELIGEYDPPEIDAIIIEPMSKYE